MRVGDRCSLLTYFAGRGGMAPLGMNRSVVMFLRRPSSVVASQVKLPGSTGVPGGGQGSLESLTVMVPPAAVQGTMGGEFTAKGQSGMGSISVIGPPRFIPDGMQLVPGGRVRVTVVTTGRIDACQALPAFGMHVTSGSQDLMAGAGGIDLTGDGSIDIDIAVDATLSTRTQTIVSCRDPFGQLAAAAFTAQP